MQKITALTLALLASAGLATAAMAEDASVNQGNSATDLSEPASADDFSKVLLALGGTGQLPSNFSTISSADQVEIVQVSGLENFDRAGLDAAVAANQSNIDALRAQVATNAAVAGMVDVNSIVGADYAADGHLILYVDNQQAAAAPLTDQTTTGSVSTGTDTMNPDPQLDLHSSEPGTVLGNGGSDSEEPD